VTFGHLRTFQLAWTLLPQLAGWAVACSRRHVRTQAWQDLLSRSDPALLPEPDWWLSGCEGFVRESSNGPAFVVWADGRLDQPPLVGHHI
jgi:hypothetical protein